LGHIAILLALKFLNVSYFLEINNKAAAMTMIVGWLSRTTAAAGALHCMCMQEKVPEEPAILLFDTSR
jgi:hypothetical protein